MAFIQSEHFCRRDWCIFSAERENYFPLSYTHRADILLLIYLEANDPDSRMESPGRSHRYPIFIIHQNTGGSYEQQYEAHAYFIGQTQLCPKMNLK